MIFQAASLFETVIFITAVDGNSRYITFMLKKKEPVYCSKEIQNCIKKNQGMILQKSNYLLKRSESLSYEGRVYHSQKLRRLRAIQKEVNNRFLSYIKVEEGIIFPFLETHIPRLAPFIHMFQEENEEIKKSLKEINRILKLTPSNLNAREQRASLGMLGEQTAFLYYFVVSHFEMEEKSLYKCIELELHSDEQHLLLRKLIDCGNITSIMKDRP